MSVHSLIDYYDYKGVWEEPCTLENSTVQHQAVQSMVKQTVDY